MPTGRTSVGSTSTATQDVDFESLGWSPDGKHLSFMSAGVDGVTGWQINIADIDADGDADRTCAR